MMSRNWSFALRYMLLVGTCAITGGCSKGGVQVPTDRLPYERPFVVIELPLAALQPRVGQEVIAIEKAVQQGTDVLFVVQSNGGETDYFPTTINIFNEARKECGVANLSKDRTTSAVSAFRSTGTNTFAEPGKFYVQVLALQLPKADSRAKAPVSSTRPNRVICAEYSLLVRE